MEKTPQEIDAMSSEEYAQYIKYNRSEAAVVPPAPAAEVHDDIPVTPVAPVEAPVVEPVAVVPPPAPVEKKFEYQSKDAQGRPLGGKQTIIYTDEADLLAKVAAKEEQLVRKLREVTVKQKLGVTDDDIQLPSDTEFANLTVPQPKTLTAEERFQLSQDLNDPEKAIDAVNKIFEASVGLSAEQMRKNYSETEFAKLQYRAAANYMVFEGAHKGEFDPSPENKQVLTDWMFKKGLAPTVANFELAHSKLKEAGLLLDSPIVREETPAPVTPAPVSTEPKAQAPVATESRITPAEQPQPKRQAQVPSGLNSSNSSDSSPASPKTSLTLAEIEKMPSDDYKKRMKDPAFRKLVDELENQAANRRRASIA
jgi:hypothetical protein